MNRGTTININTNSSARINMKIRMKNKIGKAFDKNINAKKITKINMCTYKQYQY